MTNDAPGASHAPDPRHPEVGPLTPDGHRRVAIDLFNFTWTILDRADRSAADVDLMLHAAHASRFHWGEAAGSTPNNLARGEWLCSRVYAVMGRPEPAAWHARRTLEICDDHGIGDWDRGFAYEALARAAAVGGDATATAHWLGLARAAADAIVEEEDRALLLSDLRTI